MRIEAGQSLYWIGIVGLVGMLAMGGCAKKSVVATTSGTEVAKVEAKPPAKAETGDGPLGGLSKSPQDEAVKGPPMMVAKADEAEIAARKAREAAQKQLADIYFAFDKWALTTDGKKNLTQSADALKQVPRVKLLIEGHCDERGSREYNLVLGEKRAKETERFLLGLGIQNQVTVTSYGKERPVCAEHDESCYWKNRRAHLVLEDAK
ncbi:MAG: peptidoglycan-associated lipoprotein [Nitrospirae bacterium]|nr:MAG: peptidoglycan-associated lipoprotein [Nitrospirota bacterium]